MFIFMVLLDMLVFDVMCEIGVEVIRFLIVFFLLLVVVCCILFCGLLLCCFRWMILFFVLIGESS